MKSVGGICRGGCHGDLEPAVMQQLHVHGRVWQVIGIKAISGSSVLPNRHSVSWFSLNYQSWSVHDLSLMVPLCHTSSTSLSIFGDSKVNIFSSTSPLSPVVVTPVSIYETQVYFHIQCVSGFHSQRNRMPSHSPIKGQHKVIVMELIIFPKDVMVVLLFVRCVASTGGRQDAIPFTHQEVKIGIGSSLLTWCVACNLTHQSPPLRCHYWATRR